MCTAVCVLRMLTLRYCSYRIPVLFPCYSRVIHMVIVSYFPVFLCPTFHIIMSLYYVSLCSFLLMFPHSYVLVSSFSVLPVFPLSYICVFLHWHVPVLQHSCVPVLQHSCVPVLVCGRSCVGMFKYCSIPVSLIPVLVCSRPCVGMFPYYSIPVSLIPVFLFWTSRSCVGMFPYYSILYPSFLCSCFGV